MGQIFNFFPLSVLKSKIELSDEKKKKIGCSEAAMRIFFAARKNRNFVAEKKIN